VDDITTEKPQIFLLHFAGGSCYSFQFLLPYLEPFFAVQVVELPGRGKRAQEPFLKNKEKAVDDLYRQVSKLRNKKNFLIYGHSLGAVLGLRLSKKMEDAGDFPSS